MPSGPNQSVGGHGPQPGGWVGGYGAPPPPPRRGAKLAGVGIVVAAVFSAAALVLGIIALVRQPGPALTATPTLAPVTTPAGDTSAADKSLCEQVGPLLRQMVDDGKRFVALGDPGTPDRDADIAGYRATVTSWAAKIQPILDAASDPPRFPNRTIQTTVDSKLLYVSNIRPGPEKDTDVLAWRSGAVAYGGPWETCRAWGVTW